MKVMGRILLIDDDPSFRKLYENELGEEGYLVEAAMDSSTALTKLAEPGWDVVLLDQKLQGKGGPDSGLDLISEVTRLAPGARTILVTAYATPSAISRAFREGVYDYLQKDELFRVLLLAKLRNAVETARAQRLSALSSNEAEEEIEDTWAQVESELDVNRKGKLLEDLMVLLFKTIPGFRNVRARRRNDVEEIDVLLRNESPDPFWINERTSYILVECKNWSKPVGVPELQSFIYKLERKFDRTRLGFMVAPAGFTGALKNDLRGERKGDNLVVLVGRDALAELVANGDRNEALKRFHERAMIELNGH